MSDRRARCIVPILLACAITALGPKRVLAQAEPAGPDPTPQPEAAAPGWQWDVDSNAFLGFNHQRRKFRDFNVWESQNWLMATGERRSGPGVLVVSSMFSLEALTLRDIGSPQVFQTGETFRQGPLIDYQHPHDLVMKLGGEYRRALDSVTLFGAMELVGSPSIGPPAFMHRPSARENPQAPLSHHHMDSSHITPGVVRGGIAAGPWSAEASWFRGREPDENRLDLDLGALDSAAARLAWTHGAWYAQLSAAYLTQPELITPYDAKKLSASVSYMTGDDVRGIAWMAAFGQKREVHGNFEAYLVEATARLRASTTVYARVESLGKDILDAGFHPRGTFHRHRQSQISALTVGYVHDVLRTRVGGFGVGADFTGYLVPANLKEPYGSPVSVHGFLRYRAPSLRPNAPVHVH